MLIRRLAKDSVIYGGADFFSKLVLFFTFPVLAAALSPLAFGALELIVTSSTLLGLIMNCGINNATQRFYWDSETKIAQRPVVVSTGLAALFSFGILALALGLLLIPLIFPVVVESGIPVTWVALVGALFLMVFNQWLAFILDVTRLQFAPWRFMTVSMISRVGSAFVSVFAVVWMGWGIDGLLGAQALLALAVLPLALYFIRTDIAFRIDRKWMSELLRFGYPFIFMGLAYWLFGSMDRWMLATMSSVEEVGLYSVAFRFSTIVLFVSAAFAQAWSPVAIKIRTEDPLGYRQTYANVLVLLLYVMLLVGGGLALFSGELIYLIMPDDYADSAFPLVILSFGVIIQAVQQVAAIGISIEKKTALFARLAWFTAVINFLLNFAFIPNYGAIGAAWATMVSHMVLTGSYLYFTQRLHPLPIPWKKLLFLSALGLIVAFCALMCNTASVSLFRVSIKILLLLMIMVLGYFTLPFKNLLFFNHNVNSNF